MNLFEYLRQTWGEGAPGKMVVLSAVALIALLLAATITVAVSGF